MLKKARVAKDAGFMTMSKSVARLVLFLISQIVVDYVVKTERMSGLLGLVWLISELNS